MSDNSRNSSLKNQRIRIVAQCLIERKKESEIQECIFKETGNQVSLRTIYRDRKQINREATQFFYLLARDNDEYNQKLKNTIDSLEETLSSLKRMYKESTDILTKIKLGDLLLKYEKEVYEYYRFLPVVSSATQIKLDSADEMKEKWKLIMKDLNINLGIWKIGCNVHRVTDGLEMRIFLEITEN